MLSELSLKTDVFIQLCARAAHRIKREAAVQRAKLIENEMKPTGLRRLFRKERTWEDAALALADDPHSHLSVLQQTTATFLAQVQAAQASAQRKLAEGEKTVVIGPGMIQLLEPELAR